MTATHGHNMSAGNSCTNAWSDGDAERKRTGARVWTGVITRSDPAMACSQYLRERLVICFMG
jgi:hypothetical protein